MTIKPTTEETIKKNAKSLVKREQLFSMTTTECYNDAPGLKSQLVRRRVQLTTPEKSITNQDMAKEFTMASIVKKLQRGQPVPMANDTFYSTNVNVTNLQDVTDFLADTKSRYDSLPSEIRKLMNNDMRNFEAVLRDEKNRDILNKHGLYQQTRDGITEIVNAIKFNAENASNGSPKGSKTKTKGTAYPDNETA